MVSLFLSGALTMGLAAVGLFFFRAWKETRDRLFAIFALAFWMLGLERASLLFIEPMHEARSFIYLIRLVAFILILAAIADKNRSQRPSH
jgi:hypothetical protein